MKRWRIAENYWNLKNPPWSGAVGIEEVPDGDNNVPALLCWFTIPNGLDNARRVVTMHNASVDTWELVRRGRGPISPALDQAITDELKHPPKDIMK